MSTVTKISSFWLLLALTLLCATSAQIVEIIDSTGDGQGNPLVSPTGIAAEQTGNVFVVGTTRVFKIAADGLVTEIIDSDGDGQGNALFAAHRVAVDTSGNVYVTGAGSDNAFKITPPGAVIEIIDDAGDGQGNSLDSPRGIALDGLGNVYVVGEFSNNAFKITPAGEITEIIDATGDGQGNVLESPRAIAVDSSQNVYVSGRLSKNAFKIEPDGVITEIIDETGDGVGNSLGETWSVAVGTNGNVYVGGTANAFSITPLGTITQIIDGFGDGLGNRLNGYVNIATDGAGNVYVTGVASDNAFSITPTGAVTEIINASGDGQGNPLTYPFGIAVDGTGDVFVSGLTSRNAFRIEDVYQPPDPSVLTTGTFHGNYYELIAAAGPVSWTGARDDAGARGAHLATVADAAENEFLLQLAAPAGSTAGSRLWLGGSDAGAEGSWSWVDGTPFGFQNWQAGSPDNGGGQEHHLEMCLASECGVPGAWNDLPNQGDPPCCSLYLVEYTGATGLRPSTRFSWSPLSPPLGSPVSFTDETLGESPLTWSWDFDGDGAEDSELQNPTHVFTHPGPYQVRLNTYNPYGADTQSREVLVQAPAGLPKITGVSRAVPGTFLEGVAGLNAFDVSVDWQGSPGTVSFSVNGGAAIIEAGTATGATHAFNMAEDFPVRSAPSVVEIVAVNGEAVASSPFREYVHVYSIPDWEVSFTEWLQTWGPGEATWRLRFEAPPPPRQEQMIPVPSYVPYLSPRFGFEETYLFVEGGVSSLGTGTLKGGGATGFEIIGSSLKGKLYGEGEFTLFPPDGLHLDRAAITLELDGRLRDERGLLEVIPALNGIGNVSVLRFLNQKARVIFEIGPSLEMTVGVVQDKGELEWFGNGEVGLEAKVTLEVKVIPSIFKVNVWGAGGGSVGVGYPEPLMRSFELHAEFGAKYKFSSLYVTEGEYVCQLQCTWSTGGGSADCTNCSQEEESLALETLTSPAVAPLVHGYAEFGEYAAFAPENLAAPARSITPASVNQTVLVNNVFPGATPERIQFTGSDFLLWVHQDPLDPILQSTEISWSVNDGSGWSTPALVADDTQVELAPQAGEDLAGNLVGVWLRINDPQFTDPVATIDDLSVFYSKLDLVSAVFDPTTASWGPIASITSDTAFDSNPILSRGPAGNLMVTWLSNPGGEFVGTAASPTSLLSSFWDSGTQTWSPPQTVASGLVGVSSHTAALNGPQAFIILPRDPDGTVVGDEVLDLFLWDGLIWGAASPFAAEGISSHSPAAIYDSAGEGHVVWVRGEDLVHATLTNPSSETVRTGSGSLAFFGTAFFSNESGNLTLVWQEVADSGPANIFAAIYDTAAGSWSEDRRLTAETEVLHHDFDGFYGEDGILRAAYLATSIDRTSREVELDGETVILTNLPVEGQTDLRLFEHSLIKDLAVEDADLSVLPLLPDLDGSAMATLTVHNAGDFAVGAFAVDLWVGEPGAGGSLVATETVTAPIAAGAALQLELPFTYVAGDGDVIALVDPADEVSELTEANNRAVVYLGNSAPTAIVAASATRGPLPLTVSFDASASFDAESEDLTFSWSFSDGSVGTTGMQVEHTFMQPGQFPVSVAVTDTRGAVGTAVVVVTVTHASYPSCFHPISLTLADRTVEEAEEFAACTSLTVGPSFAIVGGGVVGFTAGEVIVFREGFSVEVGGSFTARIAPDLLEP